MDLARARPVRRRASGPQRAEALREAGRAHGRGPALPPAHALRGPARSFARIADLRPGMKVVGLGDDRGGRAAAARRRMTLYEVRLEDGTRPAEGALVQPAVPEGRAAARARGSCCTAPWSATPTASRQLMMPSPQYEIVETTTRRRHPHRPRRPRLREARAPHRQGPAARARSARASGARRPARPAARRSARAARRHPGAPRPCAAIHRPPDDDDARRAQRRRAARPTCG